MIRAVGKLVNLQELCACGVGGGGGLGFSVTSAAGSDPTIGEGVDRYHPNIEHRLVTSRRSPPVLDDT